MCLSFHIYLPESLWEELMLHMILNDLQWDTTLFNAIIGIQFNLKLHAFALSG